MKLPCYSFSKYSLSTHCVPGTILGTSDTAVSKRDNAPSTAEVLSPGWQMTTLTSTCLKHCQAVVSAMRKHEEEWDHGLPDNVSRQRLEQSKRCEDLRRKHSTLRNLRYKHQGGNELSWSEEQTQAPCGWSGERDRSRILGEGRQGSKARSFKGLWITDLCF